jgi:serine protease
MPMLRLPRPSVSTSAALLGALTALSVLAAPAVSRAQALGEPVLDTGTNEAEFLPGEIVVDVKDDLSEAAIKALGDEYGIELRDNSPGIKGDGNIELAAVPQGRLAELMDRLSRDARVEHVEPQAVARAYFTPNDPKYGDQWHLTRAGAEKAWDYSCGQGVTVAVIDTGVACYDKGPFQKGTDLTETRCTAGYNFVNDSEVAADDHGHGTHVAGTIAQSTNNGFGVAGLAYCARLMPIKVLSKTGSGTMADVAEGIRFAADHGAQVMNLSLGSPYRSKVVEDAVKYAAAKGVLVVAAAGNSGRSVGYPAAHKEAFAVSATDKNDNIAWFSSRGPQVGIGAPGVQVTQQTVCQGGQNKCEQFGVFNGTSMAAPHVAGVAAMLVAQGITDPVALRATLERTARPKTEKNLFGAGILDGGNATRSTHLWHLGMRLAALAALAGIVFARIRAKRGTVSKRPLGLFAALFGATGLLPFLPLLSVPARLGALRPAAELLMRPLGEWDLVLSADLHRYLVLASAAPVLLVTALAFGARRGRVFAGGLALGTAALLGQMALSGETLYAFGALGAKVWMLGNAALCLWVARIGLDERKA